MLARNAMLRVNTRHGAPTYVNSGFRESGAQIRDFFREFKKSCKWYCSVCACSSAGALTTKRDGVRMVASLLIVNGLKGWRWPVRVLAHQQHGDDTGMVPSSSMVDGLKGGRWSGMTSQIKSSSGKIIMHMKCLYGNVALRKLLGRGCCCVAQAVTMVPHGIKQEKVAPPHRERSCCSFACEAFIHWLPLPKDYNVLDSCVPWKQILILDEAWALGFGLSETVQLEKAESLLPLCSFWSSALPSTVAHGDAVAAPPGTLNHVT